MTVCPSCGQTFEGGACPRCAPDAASPSAAPVISDNIASALCYLLLLVTGVVFLRLDPYKHNPRVRFHALQSIFVNLAIIIFWVAISFVDRRLALLISPVYLMACLVLWLLLMWAAWQNQRIVLPLIGPMAERHA